MRIILPILLIISSLPASAIVVRHDVTDKKYGAHGSLIKPDWIVTAAHATFCISPGSYLRLNNGYHKVESVFVHKDYQPSKSHDIALIKLVNPINDVKPANLYEQTNELAKITWFIGVGGTGNGLTGQIVDNYENGGVLRKAQNQIEQAEGPLLKFKFDRDDVALPLEGVSGSGDSGGPAYSTIDGTHYLLLAQELKVGISGNTVSWKCILESHFLRLGLKKSLQVKKLCSSNWHFPNCSAFLQDSPNRFYPKSVLLLA